MTDLERMLIERACERLCLDYAHFADHGPREAFANLFAEDGEMVMPTGVTRGRAAIAAGGPANPNLVMRHVTSNIRVETQSLEAASGTAYIAAYFVERDGDEGPVLTSNLSPRALGIYRDRYVKTPEGWKFASRAFEPAIMPKPTQ